MLCGIKTEYTFEEFLAMNAAEREKALKDVSKQIKSLGAKYRDLKITRRTLMRMPVDGDTPTDIPTIKILPPTEEGAKRFVGYSQTYAVDTILKENYPKEYSITDIARQVVHGMGKRFGSKIRTKMKPNIATILANGAKEGKYLRVGHGIYKYNQSQTNGSNGHTAESEAN